MNVLRLSQTRFFQPEPCGIARRVDGNETDADDYGTRPGNQPRYSDALALSATLAPHLLQLSHRSPISFSTLLPTTRAAISLQAMITALRTQPRKTLPRSHPWYAI